MAPNRENMAPGQQNYPKNNIKEDEKLVHPGDEITKGAQQVDQLERLKPDAQNSGQEENSQDTSENDQSESVNSEP